jgi:hypothetical protein
LIYNFMSAIEYASDILRGVDSLSSI